MDQNGGHINNIWLLQGKNDLDRNSFRINNSYYHFSKQFKNKAGITTLTPESNNEDLIKIIIDFLN